MFMTVLLVFVHVSDDVDFVYILSSIVRVYVFVYTLARVCMLTGMS